MYRVRKMNTIDIIILVLLGIGMVVGFMKGLLKQLASVIGLIAGLLVARSLYGMVGEKLAPQIGTSVTVAQVISFIAIWVAIPLILYIIASMLTKALDAVHLGGINRLSGALLGILINILWIGVFIEVLQYIDSDNVLISKTKKEDSLLYYPVERVTGLFFPAIKQVTEQIIK